MNNPLAIGREFVELAEKNGGTLTPLQLIKLVFLAHGWMLAIHDRILIDEPVEAWRYGPVIPSLYQEIKHFKDGPVSKKALERNFKPLDEKELDIISQTYDIYGKFSGTQLSTLTHEPGSPWEIAIKKRVNVIDDDHIRQYYKKELISGFTDTAAI